MSRKSWFLVSVIFSLGVRLHMNLQDHASDGLLTLPLWVLWMAFLGPVAVPVKFIELHFFLFDPWVGAGHWLLTTVTMIGSASLLWFFPVGRVERWFGVFDAFAARRRPVLARSMAYALDFVNRRLFGRQKTGGFA